MSREYRRLDGRHERGSFAGAFFRRVAVIVFPEAAELSGRRFDMLAYKRRRPCKFVTRPTERWMGRQIRRLNRMGGGCGGTTKMAAPKSNCLTGTRLETAKFRRVRPLSLRIVNDERVRAKCRRHRLGGSTTDSREEIIYINSRRRSAKVGRNGRSVYAFIYEINGRK